MSEHQHPIEGMMGTSIEKIREMVDVNTIIGDPITITDGTVIIPVSKVTFGFASGGSDFPSKSPKELFGGASGAGVTIQPLAFIVINKGNVKLMQMYDSPNTTDKLIDTVPDVVDKITNLIDSNKEKKKKTEIE